MRFESAVANGRGTYPGVFALANGLRDSGRLSETDAAWLRSANDFGNAAYPVPPAGAFDRVRYPGAKSWFRGSAVDLIDYARGYLPLLARYGIEGVERRTGDPGTVIYLDEWQVVAFPRS